MTTITRPNGKTYQPRKVIAYFVYDDDEFPCGVMVLGTHDVGRALDLAKPFVRDWDRSWVPVDPLTGWYRLGYEAGRLRWLKDEEKGRAAVCFREIVEVAGDPE